MGVKTESNVFKTWLEFECFLCDFCSKNGRKNFSQLKKEDKYIEVAKIVSKNKTFLKEGFAFI